jgi:hypothetical protein
LNELASTTRYERLEFLKRFLDILPEEELIKVDALQSKAKKRRKRQTSEWSKKSKSQVTSNEGTASVPEKSASVPGPSLTIGTLPKRWFEEWKEEDIYAMDVEKVEVPIVGGGFSKKKFNQKAGSVSVVNFKCEVVYEARVKREVGSFRVTYFSRKINGFTEASLVNGKPLESVQNDLHKLLLGKLVIMVAAENDFSSLEIPMASFDVFDIHSHII